jgi:hypothetical protein
MTVIEQRLANDSHRINRADDVTDRELHDSASFLPQGIDQSAAIALSPAHGASRASRLACASPVPAGRATAFGHG